MVCLQCGASVPEGRRFCVRCGSVLEPGGPGHSMPRPPSEASSRSIVALLVALGGLLTAGLLAPVAYGLARRELRAIETERSARAGLGYARAAHLLGIAGCFLLAATSLVAMVVLVR